MVNGWASARNGEEEETQRDFRGLKCGSVVKHMPGMCEALGSILTIAETQNQTN